MENKMTGLILLIIGLFIAIGAIIIIPALAFYDTELIDEIMVFDNMEWLIFFIGIVIAGVGEYLRR